MGKVYFSHFLFSLPETMAGSVNPIVAQAWVV